MYKHIYKQIGAFYFNRTCSTVNLSKTFFNTELYRQEKTRRNYERKRLKARRIEKKSCEERIPISLKFLSPSIDNKNINENLKGGNKPEEENVHFPLKANVSINKINNVELKKKKPLEAFEEIKLRNELEKDKKLWLINYDNCDDSIVEVPLDNEINYGTPDRTSTISNVPCGGCGAFLHCKEPSLPGYIPSEIFKNASIEGGTSLKAIICQRCYFLKHHNLALEVQVSPEDYPKVLQTIGQKENAIIVLLVDLTDFPCSIWPGIADIFSKKPVIIVGNKIDLLPQDSSKYLHHVKNKLLEEVKQWGFATSKILDVLLISATTGYGVEDLITVLYSSWKYKGDVYIVGSTNVGKSSLYNILLQSDLCKSKATDLIQRATTSLWPGTTLNLLKFPIRRPSGNSIYLRNKRIMSLKKIESAERKVNKQILKRTKDPQNMILKGRIERTKEPEKENQDEFLESADENLTGIQSLGINENHPEFAFGRWCFDTPGVVQREQITDLLTSEELLLTIPKTLLRPRTFCIRPHLSLFIAGLARLDYVEGEGNVRLTVFASEKLPISIVEIEKADQFYKENLGTSVLGVPLGKEKRLSQWPGLQLAQKFTVNGIDTSFSCKDIVLSSAGWISITGRNNNKYTFNAWTPEQRGAFLRDSLLPSAVNLRGRRIDRTPCYKNNKVFVNKG